jgi:hypothetical protein
MNVADFINCTRDWASRRNAQFKFNWPVKGGWEGWIQVDLTAYILTLDSTVEILREQPIYQNARRKCDLLLNADSLPANQIPVEIKAESWNNRDNFVDEVLADLDKFDERNPAYQNSTCVMLTLPFDQPSLDEVLGIEEDGHEIFRAFFIGEVACVAAVWVAGQGWLQPNVIASEAPGTLGRPLPPTRESTGVQVFGGGPSLADLRAPEPARR